MGEYNKTFYEIGKWLLAAVIAAAVFVLIFGDSLLTHVPECVFETATGLYCPGCGGTRAVIALFEGHPVKSFLYHPAVPYAFIVYCVFMIRMFLVKHFNVKSGKDGRINIFIYIGIGIIFVQWIVKLILLIHYGIKVI
ncbi:MAG: DUF2752 domain-containing protein [Lachnospiraceae bacterium]|nr:DUF2752 domain-containing protein [Lachnospiraceae bacterium]